MKKRKLLPITFNLKKLNIHTYFTIKGKIKLIYTVNINEKKFLNDVAIFHIIMFWTRCHLTDIAATTI